MAIRRYALYFLTALMLISTLSDAQKWRIPFQYEKETNVVGEKNQLKLENTVIIKLKPEFASLLEQSDQKIKDLFYPLDIHNIKPLFKPASDHAKGYRKKNTVNLDLIYVIQYTPSTMPLDGVINFLSEFSYFEYCEPYYVPMAATTYIPNDPEVQPAGQQNYHLNHVQAFDAWAIEQGNPGIIIGVIDTGFDITHDDLKNNYVPGWDVADNDANVIHPTEVHGTGVAGVCSAEADNNLGIAGSGFKCKFMPIKASPNAGNSIVAGYAGIQYAADHGCQVMNLSWGGLGGYSATLQEAINYAAIDMDVVIVAAAGNTDMEGDFFPAAYDHVLSVCALDTVFSPSAGKVIDIRSRFRDIVPGLASTYAHSVDLGAHGTDYLSTVFSNGYSGQYGSSFSSPLVAGAAGILRAHYPGMTALQIMELLRVTSDTIYHYTENLPFLEKLGKGRLNMYRALTDNSTPAIRAITIDPEGKHGNYFLSKDTVTITLDLWNYLRKTNDLTVYLSSSSSHVTILDHSINIGVLDSMQGINTSSLPLKFKVNATAGHNATVTFRLGFVDPTKEYSDYQYFSLIINPSNLNISTSKILSTITPSGNLGYNQSADGEGYLYNGFNLLYEQGLMIATPNNQVSDCVRSLFGAIDNEFKPTSYPTYIDPAYKDMEIMNKMNDSLATSIIGVSIEQRAYTFDQPGLDQCYIVEYQITNNRPGKIDTLYTGIFSDWDIDDYSKNRAGFDYARKLGYCFSSLANKPYAGIALLTKQNPTYYAMDNGTVPDINNINPNAAFTTAQKLKTLKSGIGRAQAGMIGSGFDVSTVNGAELYDIESGQTHTVAFAILAADNLSALQLQADDIKNKFIDMKTSKVPTGNTYYLCDGETKDIDFTPGNGVLFNFYDQLTDNTILDHGNSHTKVNASTADTLYVAGADSLYESTTRVPMYINNSSTAKANFGLSSTTLTFPSAATLYLFNTSQNYTSITWDYGDGESDTDIENPSHAYTAIGSYTVSLTAMDDKGCSSTQTQDVEVSINTSIEVFPNPANNILGFGNEIIDPGTLQIVNSIGQVVYEQVSIYIHNNKKIDVSPWPEGIYTLVFTTEKKQYTQHLLIRH